MSWRFVMLFALLAPVAVGQEEDEDGAGGAAISNPYFETAQWKVWRDDPTPVEGVASMVREGKEKKAVTVTVAAPPAGKRLYPVAAGRGGFLRYRALKKPPKRFAGIWDDVYASWSGLHGYVRNRWKGPDGNEATILGGIIDFVDVTKQNTLRAGVNFIHQSTTGMAHTITNGYSVPMTLTYERLYFADALVTAPAHLSFTDTQADRSSDLFLALVPTLFNSVGSSNGETMAITKMIIAGGYLPPATKLLLKRNGLYPAAMLYLWKAALPYPVPYGHELRHRVAYKSIGNRETYAEKYGHAGVDKGDLALPFHRYDDVAHMRRMIELAASMEVALPEAVFKVLEVEGGRQRYALKKSVLIVQEKGEDVRIEVSSEDCYDLQQRPVTVRWKLLYGQRATRIEGTGAVATITVPWDDALPEGRTAIALIANNGVFDSNPAVITVYRKKGEIPPNGSGYGDYKFPGKFTNRRPVLLDVQDQVVRPGQTLRLAIDAVDPEGFPLRFYQRAGEVGEFDGNVFVWKCPSKTRSGAFPLTIILSDGTSGNSYGGKQITLHVGRKKRPRIVADRLTGPAPLTVKVKAADAGRRKCGWEFYAPALKRKPKPFKAMVQGKSATHTFDKPGVYEIALAVGDVRQTVGVLVTAGPVVARPAALGVEGNGLDLVDGDETPALADHTDFGTAKEREFLVFNRGDARLVLKGSKSVVISGADAKSFRVVRQPRTRIEGRGSSRLVIRFTPKPKEGGERSALVAVRAGKRAFTFAVQARGTR